MRGGYDQNTIVHICKSKILIYDCSHLNFFQVLVSLNMVDNGLCVCVCVKTEDPQKKTERKEGMVMALGFKVPPLQYLHRFGSRTCRGDCERIVCGCTGGS